MFCLLSLLLFPLLVLWWIEINCRSWSRFITDRDKNTLLWLSHNRNIHLRLRYSTCPPPFAPSLPYLTSEMFPPLYCSSLFSPPPALSRAVMGLDRESDVVHIETRFAKGREFSTSVHRCSRTLCLSFRARSRGRWKLFCYFRIGVARRKWRVVVCSWMSPLLNPSLMCHRHTPLLNNMFFQNNYRVFFPCRKDLCCSFGQKFFYSLCCTARASPALVLNFR